MRPLIGSVRGHLLQPPQGDIDGARLLIADRTSRRPARWQTYDQNRTRDRAYGQHRDPGIDGDVDVDANDNALFVVDVDVLGGRIVVRGPVDAGTAGVIVHCIDLLAQMCATSITVDLTHAELVLVVAVRRIEAASATALRSGSSVALVADGGSLAHRVLTTWTTLGPA